MCIKLDFLLVENVVCHTAWTAITRNKIEHEKQMENFSFVSSFKREEETWMNARDTVAESSATSASQVSLFT
jgi:hypothetical protein